MSHSMRFIGAAIVAWIGFRALSLGLIPGAEAFAFDRRSSVDGVVPASPASPPLPPIVATQFAPIEPVAPSAPAQGYPYPYPPYGYAPSYAYAPPVQTIRLVQASLPAPPRRLALDDAGGGWSLDTESAGYGEVTPLEQWPLAQIARGSSAAPAIAQSVPVARQGLDRLSLTAWAMLRREPGGPSLASNGMLGGSQAGARLLWRFDPRLAASIRTSAPIGGVQRTAELAAGVRWQPFTHIPVALTAERRQSFGRDAGRSAFALFAEGGVYDRPIAAGFNLDAYLQGGVVGIRRHMTFVDGSATFTRPLWRQFSAGAGLWGGYQPGLTRIDAGPRVSMRVGGKMRVHLDYRQRLAGAAAPGSGPVITIAGDF